jgi:hypothetical protein
MKAIAFTKFGQPDVLQLQKVEKFTLRAKEVLKRIVVTTVAKVLRLYNIFEFKTQCQFGVLERGELSPDPILRYRQFQP